MFFLLLLIFGFFFSFFLLKFNDFCSEIFNWYSSKQERDLVGFKIWTENQYFLNEWGGVELGQILPA